MADGNTAWFVYWGATGHSRVTRVLFRLGQLSQQIVTNQAETMTGGWISGSLKGFLCGPPSLLCSLTRRTEAKQ